MVVGVARLTLRLEGISSLKEKRGIIKRVAERVRHGTNATVAEVGRNDAHGWAELGLAVVGNDQAFVNSCLDKAINLIDRLHLVELWQQQVELIHFGEFHSS